jgi:undecaprenyl-diphosphatase
VRGAREGMAMTEQVTEVPPAAQPATNLLRPIERFTGRSIVGLVAVAAGATGFGALLVLVRLHWTPLESVDRGVAAALNKAVAERPLAVDGLTALTGLGGNGIMWYLVTVTAAAMLIRRQVRLAAYLVTAGLGAIALTAVVKTLVGRLRPVVADPITTAPGNSFPSGHALNATVFYGALLLVFLPTVPRRFRGWAIGATVTVIILIGFTRAALGVHYMSDVIAGWLLGAVWLAVTAHAFRILRRETGEPARPMSEGLEPEAAPELAPADIRAVRHPWLSAAGLLVAFLGIIGVLYLFGTFAVRYAPAWDEGIPAWFAAQRTPQRTGISEFWSDAGGTHWILTVGLVIGPLAMAFIRRWRPAIFLVVLMFGELGLFLGSAALVGRARPLVTLLDGHLPTSSFPSGHVAATTCLYGALAILVVPRTRGFWRWAVIALAVLMPSLVALSRIYRGAHHPLDVAGGLLLALLWLTAVTIAVQPNADLYEADRLPTPVSPAATPVPAATSSAPSGPPAVVADRADVPRVAVSEGPKRSAVVVNPSKLILPQHRAEIAETLKRAGWPEPLWLETTVDDPGGGQARQAIEAGVDVVFAAGGDGTVMACANAVTGTDTALAIVPCGTGNLLARNLELPIRPRDAVELATENVWRRLDVGVVDGEHCFLVMAGMGFDAQMLHDAPAALKARIGWAAYGVAAARHLCEIPMRLRITLDDGDPVSRRARAVLIGNVGRLQGGVRLLPQARPDDGMLDVAVLMPPRRRNWFMLAWALLRQRRTPAALEVMRARRIHIESDQEHPRELDGDLIDPSNAMTVTVLPAALWLCVPPSTVDSRPTPARTTSDPDSAPAGAG